MRNAEPRSLCDLLSSVRAFRQLTGTKIVAQDQIADVPLIDVVVQRIGVEGGDLHQTGFLLEGHSRKQVRHARADRQSPIFVGVEYAVSVQILEREIPNFQQSAPTRLLTLRCLGTVLTACGDASRNATITTTAMETEKMDFRLGISTSFPNAAVGVRTCRRKWTHRLCQNCVIYPMKPRSTPSLTGPSRVDSVVYACARAEWHFEESYRGSERAVSP